MLLNGKTAVVTGGTRGIGFAIVKKFLNNGANVVLTGSRPETVDKALFELSAYGNKVIGLHPNLCDADQMAELVRKTVETYGRLDIWVNNAGISARDRLYDYDPADFDRILDVNLKSVFIGCQAAACEMKKQGGGTIINTSSMVSIYGQPSGCGYPATKFAVNGLTRSLARELGRDHIRVNAVAPGVTRTDMAAALPKEVLERISAPIPLGRIGEPEEVANAFLFLASDLASYITGTILSVDGAAIT